MIRDPFSLFPMETLCSGLNARGEYVEGILVTFSTLSKRFLNIFYFYIGKFVINFITKVVTKTDKDFIILNYRRYNIVDLT